MKNRLIRTMLSVALTVCLMSNTVSAGEWRTPEIEETHEAVTDNSKAETMDVSAGDVVQEYTAEVPVVGATTGLTYTVEGDTVTITGEGECWTVESEIQNAISNAKHVVFRDCKILGSMKNPFSGCSNLESINLSGLDTSEVTDMSWMFYNCSNLTSLDVSGFDTSQVTDMGGMFCNCSNLISLDVSGFDTSQVTDMGDMFYNCSNLTSLDVSGFNTSQVTSMSDMFHDCSNLTSLDVSGFDTSKVTGMMEMFFACSNLTRLDVSGFDTSRVTDMDAMFCGCANLTSLDVSGFDTSKVTDMSFMFGDCSNLTSLDVSGFDTSKVTNMGWMFYNCSNLTSLDVSGFDTSKVTNMGWMFGECSNLTTLDISGFNISKTTIDDNMLWGCQPQYLYTPRVLPEDHCITLAHAYQTPSGVITNVLTPEFAGITLTLYKTVDEQFTDVQSGAWYVSAVQYAYDNGIMTGKTATTFAPNANLTRAEFTTVLYSQAGKPAVTYQPIFKDVEQGAWYSSPVLWAYDEEIVSGYTNGCFGTSDKITREQLALMMYKYAQTKGYDTTADADILSSFSDEAAISNWARGAIQWAASWGIMSGKGKGSDGKPMLDPKGNATRAECAAMIKKLLTME